MGLFSREPKWYKQAKKHRLDRYDIEEILPQIISKLRKNENDKDALRDLQMIHQNITTWNGGGWLDDLRKSELGQSIRSNAGLNPDDETPLDTELKWFQEQGDYLLNLSDDDWKDSYDESGHKIYNPDDWKNRR